MLQPGAYCRLFVTDTGCGMSAEISRRVFDPFFTTKEAGAGTGLGLAAVYGFAQRSGGHVAVHSDGPDTGAAFTMYLPLVGGADVPSDEYESLVFDGDLAPTVLFAEDDTQAQDVGRRMLEESGCYVLCASDGESALEMYIEHANEVSLVLLDAVMPRLSGRRVFEEIRRLQADVPIVFCTGYDPGAVQGDSLRQAGDGLIAKPFDKRQLLEVVHRLLQPRGEGVSV